MTSGFFQRPVGGKRTTAPVRPIPQILSQRQPGRTGAFIGNTSAWMQKRGWRRLIVDAVLVGSGCSVLYVGFLWLTLPDISNPRTFIAAQSSVITDRTGTELYRLFGEQDRTYITGDAIPQHMKDAIVAIEDARYFEHGCFDVRAIARAVFVNAFFGQSQGASTLTQQLARNALLTREKKISRKIKELMLACGLERRYSKQELLELYLNWIPFGQNVYGLEQASRTFFGIPAKDLTLAQSAVLAAIPQRPTYFNPYGNNVRTRVTEPSLRKILDGTITKASDIPDANLRMGLLGANAGTGTTLLYIGGRTDQVLRNMQ
ncbi:transglycosylase domain-containing protein, partial [Candidatus Peregrinibacteria bacterium]|nr:transglycosylase domain-containing protein [Candidatus Peregrinibacteria bacterium]